MKEAGKFEDSWKKAFEEAEITPSDSVWVNLDRDLANAEGSSMKKRVVFYQRLAAASVLFALLVGGFGLYRWKENYEVAVVKEKVVAPSQENNKAFATDANSNSKSSAALNSNPQGSMDSNVQNNRANEPKRHESSKTKERISDPVSEKKLPFDNVTNRVAETNHDKQRVFSQEPKRETSRPNNNSVAGERESYVVALAAIPAAGLLPVDEISGGPVMQELVRKLPAISGAFMAEPTRKKINHEQLWASATAATGNYSTVSNPYSAFNGSGIQSASSGAAVGTSYSYGMLAGMRVSNRIVVQSGVQYSNQTNGTTSNINAVGSLAAVANFNNNPTNPSVSYTPSTYNITSSNEFVSVPLQAGYLFIDRKVGLQLNSGVSTDFFVRNTLADPSGLRQSYSQGAGQDSPYRSVNFSGLMSSEVSYKLGKHYRISVVPGVRYSFSSILKSSAASGNLMVWDVGFRFRYIFK